MAKQRTARTGADQGTHPGEPSKGQMQDQAQGDSVVHQVKDTAQSLGNQAQGKARALAGQAQDAMSQQVQSGVRSGKNRAADTLDSIAQSLVFSGQQLRAQDQQRIGRYAEQAANKVEELADYLQNTSAGELADRVESFARREPAIFLGGAFALGLFGARFLKSSRRQQPQTSSTRARRTNVQRGAQSATTRGAEEMATTRGALSDVEITRPLPSRNVDTARAERSRPDLGGAMRPTNG